MSKKVRTLWRVGRGVLEPYDSFTRQELRARRYKLGDLIAAELFKARSPGFHRLAHQLGSLLAENLDAFDGMDAHAVLKRLQIEGRIACDEIGVLVPDVGMCVQYVPRSLSYESMDDHEFRETIKAMCRYVADTYWPTCSPEKIEAMAQAWVDPT